MKRVYAVGFIFLDVVFDQGARAAMPGCVVDCLGSTSFGCGSGDIDCLCSASKCKELIAELSSCIKKGCKPDEVVSAEDSYGPLYVRAEVPKIGPEEPSSTTAGANAPANPAGQGAPSVESSATAKEVMEISSVEVVESTEEAMPTEVDGSDVVTTLTEDIATSTSAEVNKQDELSTLTDDRARSTSTAPVKAGGAASAPTAIVLSETTTSTSTKSSTTSSTSTEEEQATDTVLPASDKYYHSGGLSAGAKAGIGVGVALGVIGLGCLVAAIWLIRRRRAATSASGMDVTHAKSVKSPNPFSRQVEVAEIDGRPAPQEMPA